MGNITRAKVKQLTERTMRFGDKLKGDGRLIEIENGETKVTHVLVDLLIEDATDDVLTYIFPTTQDRIKRVTQLILTDNIFNTSINPNSPKPTRERVNYVKDNLPKEIYVVPYGIYYRLDDNFINLWIGNLLKKWRMEDMRELVSDGE